MAYFETAGLCPCGRYVLCKIQVVITPTIPPEFEGQADGDLLIRTRDYSIQGLSDGCLEEDKTHQCLFHRDRKG